MAGIGARVAPGINIGFSVDQSRSAIDIPLALQSATIDLTQLGFTASVDSGPWTWASAVVHGFGNINSRRDTGLGLATAGYNARLDGVLSEISYYWTRDQGRIVPKAAFEYVRARTGSLQEIGGLDPVTATGATVQRGRLLIGAEIGHYWIFDGKIFDLSGYGKFVDNVVQNFSDITVSQGVQSITFQGIGESQYGARCRRLGVAEPDQYRAPLRQLRRQIPQRDAVASGHAGAGVEVVARLRDSPWPYGTRRSAAALLTARSLETSSQEQRNWTSDQQAHRFALRSDARKAAEPANPGRP